MRKICFCFILLWSMHLNGQGFSVYDAIHPILFEDDGMTFILRNGPTSTTGIDRVVTLQLGSSTNNAVAGLVIDAQNGDFIGADYFTLYQYDNGEVEIRNLANRDLVLETNRKKVRITSRGDVYVESPNQGVILAAPSGECFRIVVTNTGLLGTQAVSPCPN